MRVQNRLRKTAEQVNDHDEDALVVLAPLPWRGRVVCTDARTDRMGEKIPRANCNNNKAENKRGDAMHIGTIYHHTNFFA